MSAIDVFNNRKLVARDMGIINGFAQRVKRYRTYRQTLEELESLSDRELADLSISRSQIRGIAYRAAYDG